MRAALLLLGLGLCLPAQAALRLHWVDHFTADERERLGRWLGETHAGVEALVGGFPFDVEIYLQRQAGAGEPVPWANTERSPRQGIRFHVDPAHSLDQLRGDWTAPHEFSHLVLPYLGADASWFAEGFASYLQYRVMQAMGVLSAEEAAARLHSRLRQAAREYPYRDRSFAAAAPALAREGRYPLMYWGGAAYFEQVDRQLQQSGSSLLAVLREYLACCRRDRDSLGGLVAELDRVAESDVFAATLLRFRETPGFPSN